MKRTHLISLGLLLCLGCPQRSHTGSSSGEGSQSATREAPRTALQQSVSSPRRPLEMAWNDPDDVPELTDEYFSTVSEHDGAENIVALPRPDEVAGSRSRSIGPPNAGWLVRGKQLEPRGLHHRVLQGTVKRQWNYGTDTLVTLLKHAAKVVHDAHGGPPLRVGNLSRQRGGKIAPSVSHQSGRDADIGLYSTDLDGKPVDAPGFPKFNGARGPLLDTTGAYLFDVVRNWTFVEALLRSNIARLQWVFLDTPLKDALLDHAIRIGTTSEIIDRAEKVIVRPKNSSPHANHFHIRIFCTDADSADPIALKYACRDYGPEWDWVKRDREIGELLIRDQLDRIMKGEMDLDLNPLSIGTSQKTAPSSPEQLQDPPTSIPVGL